MDKKNTSYRIWSLPFKSLEYFMEEGDHTEADFEVNFTGEDDDKKESENLY